MTIPKYIQAMLQEGRLALASPQEQAAEHPEAMGYTWRLYRLNNHQYPYTLEAEARRVTAWARRQYADSYTGREVYFTEREHRKPYYLRDYILLVITDPVALALERALAGRKEARRHV